MDTVNFFEKNLLALSAHNPDLCPRFRRAQTDLGRYKFIESASGEIIPAIVDPGGSVRPLHSTVNPRREAARLVSSVEESTTDTGFFVFLGLGAGFAPEAALQTTGISGVTVIEYGINGVAELFCYRDYSLLFEDPRFTLLVDPDPEFIEKIIPELYRPVLCGGIKMLPLRARTDSAGELFTAAARAVQRAIEKVSSDYSVQAHFGTRWFVNIIRNLESAGKQSSCIQGEGFRAFTSRTKGSRTSGSQPVNDVAICAAGPSLDEQIPVLAEQREKAGVQKLFVISTDTALPALLCRGVKPDAVVSIDCQHISYYHFMGLNFRDIPLFLDISSPAELARFSDFPFFFSGGHPLAGYISQCRFPVPRLDTSGGNVTYACLSLAGDLGARRITVFGADFSYPLGKIYTRGAYIFPLFQKKQNRFTSLEAQISAFLYRNSFLPSENAAGRAAGKVAGHADNHAAGSHCYETAVLRFYRKAFERKASEIGAKITAAQGRGVPLNLQKNTFVSRNEAVNFFAPCVAETNTAEFLERYRRDIAALPVPLATGAGTYLENLSLEERRIAVTLLPTAAAVKRRRPELGVSELFDEVKRYSVDIIDKITGN